MKCLPLLKVRAPYPDTRCPKREEPGTDSKEYLNFA